MGTGHSKALYRSPYRSIIFKTHPEKMSFLFSFGILKINSTFVEQLKIKTMSKIKLTEAEQFIMEVIWSKEKAFMKDIMEAYDDPKPASTTLATVLKRMQDKNLVGYETVGNSRQYYSLVKKNNTLVEKCKA